MLQESLRKKAKKPTKGGESSFETTDISGQVPDIDDVLADIEAALKSAERIEAQIRPQGCGCGGY